MAHENKMSTLIDDLWQAGCERLATQLPEQQFNTWIRPLPPAQTLSDGDQGLVLCLRVPNRFKLDWIRSQYAGRIETAMAEVAGRPVRLELALAPREPGPRGAEAVRAAPAQHPAQGVGPVALAASLPVRPAATALSADVAPPDEAQVAPRATASAATSRVLRGAAAPRRRSAGSRGACRPAPR